VTATTPEPKTWGRSRVSGTDLNREVRDQIRDLQSRINALSGGGGGSLFPTGAIIAWTGQNVPSGWLLCDGRTVLKADYLSLSNEIGVAYNVGGIDLGLSFRLPKLNDALPRGAAGSVNGLIDARGEGAGANSTTLIHPADVGSYTGDTANQNSFHTHDTTTIHAGAGHADNHTHTINQNTGGHNHNMGHNHNLGVDGVAVNRNTGSTIVAVGHNHSCGAANVDTTSDGAHNHAFNQGQSASISAPSTDTANNSSESYSAINFNLNHVHNLTHTHVWTGTHTLGLVPSSLSVNYIIKT
jgi:microcystin-dependent protein